MNNEEIQLDQEQLRFSAFLERTAKACHTANRAYCIDLGDTSQPLWEDASDAVREATYDGVIYVLDHPDVTAEQMHMNWKRGKIKAGWIYGPVKNEVARMHPSITSFDKLPVEQQFKDDLFIQVVQALKAQEESEYSETNTDEV